MEYVYTAQNIKVLLKMIPMATEEQLLAFFADELEPEKTSEKIDNLCAEHSIIRQVQNGEHEVLTVIRPIRFTRRAVEDFIDAFWVIVNFGSQNVRWVTAANGPTKYFVLLEDGTSLYDISVIRTPEEARIAQIERLASLVKSNTEPEEDYINHIALVYSQEAGESMKHDLAAFGFDSYCVIEEGTHRAIFYELG